MEAAQTLHINMLGEFTLTSGDKSIKAECSRSKKLWTFLEYIITFRDKEIPQEEIIEVLWPDDEISDPANTLKTLLHRARGTVAELGFTNAKQFISYSKGAYRWTPAVNCAIDAEQFEQLCSLASYTADEAKKSDLLLMAADIYKGDFLPKMSMEFWAVPISTYYHSQYVSIVRDVLDMLNSEARYADTIKVCQKAVVIEPYDEKFHFNLIRALVATGAQRAALRHYDYVTDLFFNQFGITPSKELTALYKDIVKTSKSLELDLNVIKEDLCEGNINRDAFYCEYAFFKDFYRLEARSAARTGRVLHLGMITVSGIGESQLKQKQLAVIMEKLKDIIGETLRISDIFCRYSIAQYLVMLPSASYENGNNVLARIIASFRVHHPKSNVMLHYKLLPVDPLN